MNTRTPLVDRTLMELVIAGIPGDVPESVIKHHRTHSGDFHAAIQAAIWAPLPRTFKPGTLKAVQAQGGQFARARLTPVPGGEILESQRRNQTIRFRTDWHLRTDEVKKLEVEPSIGSEVIYLPNLVEGSLNCTYDKVEGRTCVQDVLGKLPNVEGVRWIVGNSSTVCLVLANHLKDTGQHLLPNVYTWTTDKYHWSIEGFGRLIVGCFGGSGVDVGRCPPGIGHGRIGLFVLGVPA